MMLLDLLQRLYFLELDNQRQAAISAYWERRALRAEAKVEDLSKPFWSAYFEAQRAKKEQE